MNINIKNQVIVIFLFVFGWFALTIGPSYLSTYVIGIVTFLVFLKQLGVGDIKPFVFFLIFSIVSILFSYVNYNINSIDISFLIKIIIISLFFIPFSSSLKFKPDHISRFLSYIYYINMLCVLLFFIAFVVDLTSIGEAYLSNIRMLYNENDEFKVLSRSTGLISNPNQYGKLLIFILISNFIVFRTIGGSKIIFIGSLFILVILLFSTGSRTALVIFLMSLGFFILTSSVRRLYSFFACILILCLWVVGMAFKDDNLSRSLNLSEAGSLEYKLKALTTLGLNMDLLGTPILFFGTSIYEYKVLSDIMYYQGLFFGADSDLGYVLQKFGLLGLFYILFYIAIRLIRYECPVYVYPIFFWSVTSSLLFNVRSAIQLLMLLAIVYLSNHYRKSFR